MEIINGIDFDGIIRTSNAPKIDDINVKIISNGSRSVLMTPLPIKDNVPPILIKVSANIFVAKAVRGSIPN
jgi:hypothetical protein